MRTVAIAVALVLAGGSQGAADRWLGSWDRGSDATLEIVQDKSDPSKARMTFIVATPRGCTGGAGCVERAEKVGGYAQSWPAGVKRTRL